MKTVIYPGSFDPFTNGHLDLVVRAGKLFSRVIVAVGCNPEKNPMFTPDERVELIRKCCADVPHVSVATFHGLLVDAIQEFQADAVLRGLRAFSDFEYELQMALMNRSLNRECETIFMMPKQENSFVSSRMVKEIAMFGGDFRSYVPPEEIPYIEARLRAAVRRW